MMKLCIFVGTSVGGYAGWGLGELFGWGFFANFLLSGAGSVVGVWAGWKGAQWLEQRIGR